MATQEASQNTRVIPKLEESLLNKGFDSYKLKLDSVVDDIPKPTTEKESGSDNESSSFCIKLPSKHGSIGYDPAKAKFPNMIDMDRVSKMDYGVLLQSWVCGTVMNFEYPCTNSDDT